MLVKENKTTHSLKNVSFDGAGNLVDENSETVELIKNLSTVFTDECVDMKFTSSSKDNLEISDLVD